MTCPQVTAISFFEGHPNSTEIPRNADSRGRHRPRAIAGKPARAKRDPVRDKSATRVDSPARHLARTFTAPDRDGGRVRPAGHFPGAEPRIRIAKRTLVWGLSRSGVIEADGLVGWVSVVCDAQPTRNRWVAPTSSADPFYQDFADRFPGAEPRIRSTRRTLRRPIDPTIRPQTSIVAPLTTSWTNRSFSMAGVERTNG